MCSSNRALCGCLATITLVLLFVTSATFADVPRLINYQGRLTDDTDAPIDTTADMVVVVYQDEFGSVNLWSELHQDVSVSEGLFTIAMGSVTPFPPGLFDGSPRWMGVHFQGGPVSNPLIPIVSTAYAIHAGSADTAAYALAGGGTAWTISGSIVSLATESDSVGIGTSAPGAKLEVDGDIHITEMLTVGSGHVVNGYRGFVVGTSHEVGGNYSSVTGGTNNAAVGHHSHVGGGIANYALEDNATVCGGHEDSALGLYSFVGGGDHNVVTGSFGAIGGGSENTAGPGAFVGGGNTNSAGSMASVIAGGSENTALNANSSIGGGFQNSVASNYARIGGGQGNCANGWSGTVAGGEYDSLFGGSSNGFIGGGKLNRLYGPYGVVGGGANHLMSGSYSAILGGYDNTITSTADYSYLFGIGSRLTEDSTFMVDMPHIVFGDDSSGYEFPDARGADGQVMVSDASGQLSWGNAAGAPGWVDNGSTVSLLSNDDSVGIGTQFPSAKLQVNGDLRVTNRPLFGASHDIAGSYSAITGGLDNGALANYTVVSGGSNNTATDEYATIGGGYHNAALGSYSVVAGGRADTASGNRSVVSGGDLNVALGGSSAVGGGIENRAEGYQSVVGGGSNNEATNSSATVAGGQYNEASGFMSTICGGNNNGSSAALSTVSGGGGNQASGDSSTVGGGGQNKALANGTTVCGGIGNEARYAYDFVGGGRYNVARGTYAVVSGGGGPSEADSNYAHGVAAAVPGGRRNGAVGNLSLAAGYRAKALHRGTFVWADGTEDDWESSGENQFLIRASGGVGIGTDQPDGALEVAENDDGVAIHITNADRDLTWSTGQALQLGHWNGTTFDPRMRISSDGDVGINSTAPNGQLHVRGNDDGIALHLSAASGDITWPEGNTLNMGLWNGATFTEHMRITAGGNVGIGGVTSTPNILTVIQHSATDPVADSWGTWSSRRWKGNIEPLEFALDKVRRLRGVSFNWKETGEHDIGLIAEEVGEVIPEIVAYEDNGVDARSVDYARLVPLLIQAVKEQQGQIEMLTNRVEELEGTRRSGR